LNDFCRRFHGGESGPPKVVPYTFDEVVGALNEVTPYDWAQLLRERVKTVTRHAPLGGIQRGGWKLVYNEKPNAFVQASEKAFKFSDFSYSLGFVVAEDGKLDDVEVGSPAYQAGIGPGMKLIAVNGRKWSPEVLHAAVKAAKENSQPIELLLENAQFFKAYWVQYFEGEKNPHLEKTPGAADVLGEILKPMTP
jgi:predicted metalloprotease with PDZ domain